MFCPAVGMSDPQDPLAAPDAAGAGAHRFQNGGAVDAINERIELRRVAGQFDRVALVGDVDDAAAKYVGHALHLLALLADGAYLDQHKLPLGKTAFGEVDHLDHLDQPVQVLGDLLDHLVGPGRHDGHARQRGIFGRGDREALDVVTARREQRHDP